MKSAKISEDFQVASGSRYAVLCPEEESDISEKESRADSYDSRDANAPRLKFGDRDIKQSIPAVVAKNIVEMILETNGDTRPCDVQKIPRNPRSD